MKGYLWNWIEWNFSIGVIKCAVGLYNFCLLCCNCGKQSRSHRISWRRQSTLLPSLMLFVCVCKRTHARTHPLSPCKSFVRNCTRFCYKYDFWNGSMSNRLVKCVFLIDTGVNVFSLSLGRRCLYFRGGAFRSLFVHERKTKVDLIHSFITCIAPQWKVQARNASEPFTKLWREKTNNWPFFELLQRKKMK